MIHIQDIRPDMNTELMVPKPDIRIDITRHPSLNWLQRRKLIKETRKGMKK